MLHFIREHAKGWIAWFIVGLISIPFALWGVNSYLTGASDTVIAKVNGESIQQREYQQALQQYRDRMRTVLGDEFDPALFESSLVKQRVLNNLIEQRLLLETGIESGQRVSDVALKRRIIATPAFQKDGKFDRVQYEMVLRRAGLTPAQYEAQLRKDAIIQDLTGNIQQSAFTTSFEINDLLRLDKQMREISYGFVDTAAYKDEIDVTEQEIDAYYQQHRAEYMTPERVSVNYIVLSLDELAKQVKADEQALHDYYVNNQDLFVGPEQRSVRHILIEGDEDTALKTIREIQDKLAQGEDFADLAKHYSQDAGSAAQGGDLGYFQRGVMDSAFENAVFAMKEVGEVTKEPVKTEFGYHLITLTGIKPGKGKSFAEAKKEVEKRYRYQKAETLFFDKADKLADLSYENPDSLDIAAQELGLEIKTTAAFPRTGGTEALTKNKKFIEAAFSEDVLTNDLNSAVIEIDKSTLIVLHKQQYFPKTQLALDAIAPAIESQLKYNKAVELAREEGQKRLQRLKSGEEGELVFGKDNWHGKALYSRRSDNISQQILQHAFAMPKPAENSVFKGFTAANGNYIVVELSAVLEGGRPDNPNVASDEERESLAVHLQRINGDSELQAFIEQLKQEADIEIFEQYL